MIALGPAESAKFIVNNSVHVKIKEQGLEKLSEEILSSMKEGKLNIPVIHGQAIHPSNEAPRAADWVFVADALNFCFWSFTSAPKWTVDGHSGYYALEAALARAMKEGYDILNPKHYSKITKPELKHIMRSDNSAEIPLLNERLSVLHEVGAKLLEKYQGTFENCIKVANKSAQQLIQLVVQDFPCFRDEAEFKGQKVALYKRAQILVSDLHYFFDKEGMGSFNDLDSLTMFADYRVPQVLMYFGVLTYSEELMYKLKNDMLLLSGSEEEVEIRGGSIHAVELLKKRIAEKLKHGPDQIERPNSPLIDYYLWCYRRKYASELDSIPFHKTLGIYY